MLTLGCCFFLGCTNPIMRLLSACGMEPHQHTVIRSFGSKSKMIPVRCKEPQRIYDLMKKHGLICSNVWDSTVALSARSPCTALCDHNMGVVNVNTIPHDDLFGREQKMSKFYHNMKYIRMQTEGKVLKHKPYTVPRPYADPAVPWFAPLDEDISLQIEDQSIPVAIYYEDDKSKVRDAIEADGRFVDSFQCIEQGSSISTQKCIADVDRDTDLHIINTSKNSANDDESSKCFACVCCYDTADAYLKCGHLCCTSCVEQMGRIKHCGVCRKVFTNYKVFEIAEDFDFTCSACGVQKMWITNCGHVTCTCTSNNNTRCSVCNSSIGNLVKVWSLQ